MNYDDLSDKKQKFIDEYIRTASRDDAYKDSGYSIVGRGWKANARKLYFELFECIKQRIDDRIGAGAIIALSIVKEIMEDTTVSPAVRLNAAKDYLQRAGYDKPVETNINLNDNTKKTDEQIQQEIRALMQPLQAVK